MYTIINVKHVGPGEMNGKPYDNHKFTCFTGEAPCSLVCGQDVQILKIKTPTYLAVIQSRGYDPSTFAGNILVPCFDQYGNMIDFKVESAT